MSPEHSKIASFGCLGVAILVFGALPELLSGLPRAQRTIPDWLSYGALAVGISTAVIVWNAVGLFAQRRHRDRGTSRVRSLAAGLVELQGRAADAVLDAPLSGARCVYWAVSVWEHEDEHLTCVHTRDSSAWPIPLRDATGTAWIDVADTPVVAPHGIEIEVDTSTPGSTPAIRWLEVHHLRRRTLRLIERRIEAGDPLFVHGQCRDRASSTALRARVKTLRDADAAQGSADADLRSTIGSDLAPPTQSYGRGPRSASRVLDDASL